MKIVLGASGAGKSTILRLILGLLKPDSGRIWVNGTRVDELTEQELMAVRTDLGMVFRGRVVRFPHRARERGLPAVRTDAPAHRGSGPARGEKSWVSSASASTASACPRSCRVASAGRVAIARAITARPKIVLYDEPTTGLDPITALTIDDEIIKLRDLEAVTSIVVTHQLRDAFHIATHRAVNGNGEIRFETAPLEDQKDTEFLMLRDGEIAFEGPAAELRASTDPYLKSFLS
jgi:phospholipid/cholesterol/gamma-HCH transport system ATP-binding protein